MKRILLGLVLGGCLVLVASKAQPCALYDRLDYFDFWPVESSTMFC